MPNGGGKQSASHSRLQPRSKTHCHSWASSSPRFPSAASPSGTDPGCFPGRAANPATSNPARVQEKLNFPYLIHEIMNQKHCKMFRYCAKSLIMTLLPIFTISDHHCIVIHPFLFRHLQRVCLRPGPLGLRRRRCRLRLRVRRHGGLLGLATPAKIGGKFKI